MKVEQRIGTKCCFVRNFVGTQKQRTRKVRDPEWSQTVDQLENKGNQGRLMQQLLTGKTSEDWKKRSLTGT